MDKPKDGKLYALTGGPNDRCIANGNSWEESEIKELEVGQYCRIRRSTIFGTYYGNAGNGKSHFYDDELRKMRVVHTNKLKAVEKW